MRIVSFSVQKYRSITSAQKLPLGRVTTLIGPNNEGKSNILRALVVGMRLLAASGDVLIARRRRSITRPRRPGEFTETYDWERDFPKSLQRSQPNGRTIFDFEFELDPKELDAFRVDIQSALNGSLPIRLMIDQYGGVEVKVRKQGRGGSALTKKAERIASFVGSRIRFQYVPSIRTAEEARRVVDDMVSAALVQVEQSEEFRSAVRKIEELQAPVLNGLSDTIGGLLKEFLPDVKGVVVGISSEARYTALRAPSHITVDDGTPTDLSLKGDGVQSLAAMALLRRASAEAEEQSMHLVLAIEEPEAHLHPAAVHRLKDLLEDMGLRQQVIITTHSPLLADRINVRSNIIVHANEARPARRISTVRDVLGVRMSDNLESARVVLVVEGEDDVLSLRAILRQRSRVIRTHLEDGALALESLGGASNLPYKLSHLRACVCQYHVFVDNDQAGRQALQVASREGLLRESEQTLAMCPGMQESEIEDLFRTEIYATPLTDQWNISLDSGRFRNSKSKWSDRMKDVFVAAGQPWNQETERRAKKVVADCIAGFGGDPLIPEKSGPVDAIVRALEARLDAGT